jgi:hypothetical protein
MPITASINCHPETENQSETAAPHPEEMKATFDLTIGNAVSVKATRADNAGRLGGSCVSRCRSANPRGFACKETAGRETSSAIGKPEGKRRKGENSPERAFIGGTRAEATRMADEWWGRQKGQSAPLQGIARCLHRPGICAG